MESKSTCVISTILWALGLLLLLAAAFDVLPMSDNKIIFLAIACFILVGVAKKIGKAGGGGGSCCGK
jgi:hypothetical protein